VSNQPKLYPHRRKSAVIYDADCGACSNFRKVLEFLDPREDLEFLSLAEAEESGILDSVPLAVRFRTFHLILPSGQTKSGAQALPDLIRQMPSGRIGSSLIAFAPLGPKSLAFLYTTLSRLHNAGSCGQAKASRLRANPSRDGLPLP